MAVALLAGASEAGLTAMPSGRFFGIVIGGTHPAGVAADWLVSAWDQNSGLRDLTPAHTAVEGVTSAWLVELGLPAGSAAGFTTGARRRRTSPATPWRERSVLRISVSNWSTTDEDVERSLAAVRTVTARL